MYKRVTQRVASTTAITVFVQCCGTDGPPLYHSHALRRLTPPPARSRQRPTETPPGILLRIRHPPRVSDSSGPHFFTRSSMQVGTRTSRSTSAHGASLGAVVITTIPFRRPYAVLGIKALSFSSWCAPPFIFFEQLLVCIHLCT